MPKTNAKAKIDPVIDPTITGVSDCVATPVTNCNILRGVGVIDGV